VNSYASSPNARGESILHERRGLLFMTGTLWLSTVVWSPGLERNVIESGRLLVWRCDWSSDWIHFLTPRLSRLIDKPHLLFNKLKTEMT
jgi:hypothetical protein